MKYITQDMVIQLFSNFSKWGRDMERDPFWGVTDTENLARQVADEASACVARIKSWGMEVFHGQSEMLKDAEESILRYLKFSSDVVNMTIYASYHGVGYSEMRELLRNWVTPKISVSPGPRLGWRIARDFPPINKCGRCRKKAVIACDKDGYFVICQPCGCRGPMDSSTLGAIRKWNEMSRHTVEPCPSVEEDEAMKKKTSKANQVVFSVVERNAKEMILEDLSPGEAAIDEQGEFIVRTDEGYFYLNSGLHYSPSSGSESKSCRTVKKFIGTLAFQSAK